MVALSIGNAIADALIRTFCLQVPRGSGAGRPCGEAAGGAPLTAPGRAGSPHPEDVFREGLQPCSTRWKVTTTIGDNYGHIP